MNEKLIEETAKAMWMAAGGNPELWEPLSRITLHEQYTRAARAASAVLCDEGLRKAAQDFVNKLEMVEPAINGAFAFQAIHGANYDGPNYGEELNALKAALTRQDGPVIGDEQLRSAAKEMVNYARSRNVLLPREREIIDGLEAALAPRSEPESTQEPPSQQEAGCAKDCSMCSGEFCRVHGIEECNCDTAERHYEPERAAPVSVHPPISDDAVERHGKHWNNPDTGQAECECCCGWALDMEAVLKIIDSYGSEGGEPDRKEYPADTCQELLARIRAFLTQDGKGRERVTDPAERVNLVTGDRVRLVGQKPGETFTIESSSIYEQRKFYRLKEINGGLFLRESFRLDTQGGNKA